MRNRTLAEFVIVTYHSHRTASRELLTFIDRANEDPTLAWTFVDNSENSSDIAFLAPRVHFLDNVRLVARPDNPGFAAACNQVGRETSADWLVFINADITLERDALAHIVTALKHPSEQAGGMSISQRTGALLHQGVSFNRVGWFMDRPIAGAKRRRGMRECLYRLAGGASFLAGPSGGAGAYRTHVFRELGGFFPPFFAWGEDADLALRLHLHGHTCEGLDLGLPHQGGHSVTDGIVRRRRAFLLMRNRVWLAARLYSWPKVFVFSIFLIATLLAKFPFILSDGTLRSNLRGILSGYASFRDLRATYQGPRARVLEHRP